MGVPARILVADDDKLMHAVLNDLLAEAGYVVLSAWDGEEALANARAESPDLLLLDIMMPKRNGIQVARDLKGDAATRDIPIVIVSFLAGTPAAQVSKAEAYLQKPFHAHDLVKTVWKLLAARRYASNSVRGSSPDPHASTDAAHTEPGGEAVGARASDKCSPRR